MTTARELITRSAKLLGVVRKGEALDADEAQDGLSSLNEMLASWSNESLLIYARALDELTFVSSAPSYTIGTGATLNTERPVDIISMVVRSGDIDYPINLVSESQFEAIALKDIGGGYPDLATYDNGYPNGTLRFYPQPESGDTLRLLSEKNLTSLASLDTDIDLPSGYERALRFNLALELAPEYAVEASQLVVKGAMESLRNIKLAIAKNRPLRYRPTRPINHSIYSGWLT